VGDADRAGQIIDRIRDQIEEAPPRKDHFDLNEAIDEVIGLARGAIAKNGVSVQTRFTEGLPAVNRDRVQLQQVVLNLILNAVEAMSAVEEDVRELLLSTERSERCGVLVAVRDSGPGIDSTSIACFAPALSAVSLCPRRTRPPPAQCPCSIMPPCRARQTSHRENSR
jgi:C4-dicarboxylate-specific signal transduction histidine kinase